MGIKPLAATDLDAAVADLIKEKLEEKDLSLRQFEKISDIPVSRLSRSLRLERSFQLSEVRKIADALGMTFLEFMTLAEERVSEGAVASAAGVPDSGAGDSGAVVFGEGDGRLADNGDDVDDVLAAIEEARRSGVGLAALESDPRLAESEDFFD